MKTRFSETIGQEEAIQSFEASARHYCGVIEQVDRLPILEFLTTIQPLLADLYLKALSLPDVSPRSADIATRIDHDAWARVFDSIISTLGHRHAYWTVFDPMDPDDHESIYCSLADDLADIYRDVKEGLLQIGEPSARNADVAWEWRFGFQNHWGQHAVSAIQAVHSLLYGPHSISHTE